MNCEIEFLPVGDASKAGDAIVIRYGDKDDYELMVIDGGNLDSGKDLVTHIRQNFGYNRAISHVVLTHCDADHASGLREVLNELPVKKLWLHLPWTFAAAARPYFLDKRWTEQGLADELESEYELIAELVEIAKSKRIPIEQPFSGALIGPFRVLAPYENAYPLLLPQFDRTPDPDRQALERANFWIGKAPNFVSKMIGRLVEKTQAWVSETWENERLKDGGTTSATNETSVVLFGDFNFGRALLTGDAGVWGLTMAATWAEMLKLPLQTFSFVQIPHHGSRRNVGPTILNRLLGPIRPQNASRRATAFVSAPQEDTTHPRKMVLNAFMRRGFEYAATQGSKTVFWGGFTPRPDYGVVLPCSFNTNVEDYDRS